MTNFESFRQLHYGATPLILANAWNAKSAQLIEKHGYKAIGTSSGAISDSLGYPDGEKIPFSEVVQIIKRIKSATQIPLSVDFEKGYADNTTQLVENLKVLIDIGVSGINIEDSQDEDLYIRKLEAIKNHLLKSNCEIFINARTDGFLQKIDNPLETTIRRIKKYEASGAD